MKKIISGLIAIAIVAQSMTALSAAGTGGATTTAAESGGTQLIQGGDFSSNISSNFAVPDNPQTIVYDDGANNNGDAFLHIDGNMDKAGRYLQYNFGTYDSENEQYSGITLNPGKYVFSFKIRHGYDNDFKLNGDFTSEMSYNSYREFKVTVDLTTESFGSVGTSDLKKIFGGDLYETCLGPVPYAHPETHKTDPNGYMVFDEGTHYGFESCLAEKKTEARVGDEWRTVTKTFVIDEQLTIKNIKIHGGTDKTYTVYEKNADGTIVKDDNGQPVVKEIHYINRMSYDIDDLSLMYYGDVGSIPPVPNYDLAPVDGVAIKKGTATIDGELDAAYSSSLNINIMSANSSEWASKWNGTARAMTYYMYDDNYIYLFAKVMDDDVIKPDDTIINGNVLTYIDGTGYSDILNNDLFIWRLSLDGTPNTLKVAVDAYGNRVFGVEKTNASIMTGTSEGDTVYTKNDYSKIQKKAKLTDFGYQIEVAVPRELEKVNSKSATKLGLALEIRDLADSGSVGYECFAKAGEAYNYPVFFNLSTSSASGAGNLYGDDISGICGDDVSWNLSTDGTLTITGFGKIPNYESVNSVPWMLFMGQIRKIVIKPGITAIGDFAFEGASSVASVEIPDSVIYIGKAALKDCSSLSSIVFNGVEREWDAIPKINTWNSGVGAYKLTCKSLVPSNTNGTLGSLTWSVSNGILSIDGTGAINDFTSGSTPWHDYAANINNIVIANGITKIGDYAFAFCSGVESITVPASVTSIGKYAFAGCTKLASINLSANLTAIGEGAFENCSALTAIDIPGSVAAIGDGAFGGCDKLHNIAVNTANANYVSANGVLYTKNMETLIHYPAGKTDSSFTVPVGVTDICDNAFEGAVKLESVVVSETVTTIGSGAFSGCSALANVAINGPVSSIADDTFAYCAKLTSVILPESVNSVGSNAFVNCYNLEHIDLSHVTTIGDRAFFGCGLPADYKHPLIENFTFGTGLNSVTLSGNLTSIGRQAFANCNNLSDIYFDADRTVWNSVSKGILWDADCNYTLHIAGAVSGTCGEYVEWEFSGGLLTISGTGTMTNYKGGAGSAYYVEDSDKFGDTADIENWTPWYGYLNDITSVVIEPGVTSIGDHAFEGYTALVSVTISDSVTSIGNHAFSGCTALTAVNGMNCVETLGNGAFKGCSALTSINIPGTLKVISKDAFSSCITLATVNFAEGVTDIESYAFYNCRALTALILPEGFMNIGDYAFYSCKSIHTVNFPASLRHIDKYAFTNCANLATINYAGTVARWDTVDNVLFWNYRAGYNTAAETYLQNYADSSDKDYGMCGTNAVWSIDESGTLTIMGYGAMTNYASGGVTPWYKYAGEIKSVVLEKGITHVGDYAFANLKNVATIQYTGMNADWDAVTKGKDWDSNTGSATASGTYAFSTYQLKVIDSGSCGDNAKWKLTEDNTLTIYGIGPTKTYSDNSPAPWSAYRGTIKKVVIESGVTSIAKHTFYGCIKLTDITIADTVTSIHSDAFIGCTGLKEINIPANVSSCGTQPFKSVDNLESINVSEDNKDLTSLDGVLFNKDLTKLLRYPSGKKGTTYVVPEGVTEIGQSAFLASIRLTSVTLPSTLTTISNYSFDTCYRLTGITIPAGVTSVGFGVFSGCDALTAITVDSANTAYTAEDGVLYTKDMDTLVAYPVGKTDAAFVIPKGVETINNRAFKGNDVLRDVTIPYSVTTISQYAFENCTALEVIRYTGTDSQWSAVKKNASWDNNAGSETAAGKYTVKYELASGKCGENLEWEISVTGTLVIKGSGSMIDFATADKAPWYEYRDIIKTVAIESGVTSVSSNAFFGYNITSITVPASVTTIADNALRDCDSLTAINVDAANTVYVTVNGILFTEDMKTLLLYPAGKSETEYSIPEDVVTIGAYAFEGNENLTTVNIPVSVTAIGGYAFANCSNIATIKYASVDKDWGKVTKAENWDNGTGSATVDGKYDLIISPSTDIAEGTLGENFEWFITSDGVFNISGAGAIGNFENATTPWDEYKDVIKAVALGDGVTSIGAFAFTNFKGIESVTLGADVAAIDKHAFVNCDNLASIKVDAANASFKSDDGVLYNEDMTSLILYPAGKADTAFNVPAGVTTITSYAFRSANNIVNVSIPDSVTTIGNYAFWGSSNIETVEIGSGVSAIGSWAFAYCDSLTAIEVSADNANYTDVDGVLYTKDMKTLVSYPIGKTATTFAVPEGVKRISNYAFYGCDSLVTITLPASVTTVGNNVFNYCSALTAIEVDADNAKYADENGVLYNKEKTALVYYPAGKDETEFTVPETVTSIGKSVFEDCNKLVTVNVGAQVNSIGYAAFAYCDKLANINYAGTEAQWNEVVKGSYWNRYLDGDEVKFGA